MTPVNFFQLCFTSELIVYIVNQSNLHRVQNNKTKQSPMTEAKFNCLLNFFFIHWWSPYLIKATIGHHFHQSTVEKYQAEKNWTNIKILYEWYNMIDEQMIGYKGATAPTSFWQYMLKKPTKRGFKVWTRCAVSTFVYEMNLH